MPELNHNLPARVLVVDDEPDIVAVLEGRLRTQGFEVITAGSGYDGLELARRENPDAIILDLMLPGIDGYQVCALLKRDIRFRDVPVIILSARAQVGDVETGMRCGADAYLTKPFDHTMLVARLRELLAARHSRSAVAPSRPESSHDQNLCR